MRIPVSTIQILYLRNFNLVKMNYFCRHRSYGVFMAYNNQCSKSRMTNSRFGSTCEFLFSQIWNFEKKIFLFAESIELLCNILFSSVKLKQVRVQYSIYYSKLNFGWSLCLTTVYNYAHYRRIRNHKFKR